MIKIEEYRGAIYTSLPVHQSDITLMQLSFTNDEIAEAWKNTPNTEIRRWLSTNIETLALSNIISLDKIVFQSRIVRDPRLKHTIGLFFSSSNDNTFLVPYVFNIPVLINETVTGSKNSRIPLYIRCGNGDPDNMFIIPIHRFVKAFNESIYEMLD